MVQNFKILFRFISLIFLLAGTSAPALVKVPFLAALSFISTYFFVLNLDG